MGSAGLPQERELRFKVRLLGMENLSWRKLNAQEWQKEFLADLPALK